MALTIFVPLLLTRPGRVGADTKTYLYLDPGRLLERATSMWDPHIGLGTVTHQNIGYLWPIGPYYWLADAVGLPDWVAQRIWLGSIMFLAGLGVRFLLRSLGQEGPHVTAATFCYALTPYVLTLGARLSVILLPYAGLPWLLGLTVLALRRRRWREPALFALVVLSIGSINATALVLVGVAPLLLIAWEVAGMREVRFRDAAATVGRIGLLTTVSSLWWLSGLWAQSGYGIEILRFTETAETVAAGALSLEVLRGLGYWFFYGEDRFGPWISPSRTYLQRIELLTLSYVLPGLGLIGLAVARWRERAFFATLLAVGLVLSVGGHPWESPPPGAAGIKAFLQSDLGLAMRSLPRAAPLVVLALSVFIGSLVAAVAARSPRLARPVTAGVAVIAVLALPPLWRGQMVDHNLDRAEEIPSYWLEAAEALDQRRPGTRVLELPGSDFASYRWGNTVDPILPGLMDRPYAARELIPYGSEASADLLSAFDRRWQEQVGDQVSVAPIARFMGVGDISIRSDLSYERYYTPRPRNFWAQISGAPGLEEPLTFGPGEPNRAVERIPMIDELELQTSSDLPHPPEVAVLPVADFEPIVRTATRSDLVVLAGSGEGLVDAAGAGLVSGHELVQYSGSYAGDAEGLRDAVAAGAPLVLTDSNRLAGRRWSTVRDTLGILERVGQVPLEADPTDQRLDLFDSDDPALATVRESRGGVWVAASTYGNTVSLTPEDDPGRAADGSYGTAWRTGGFGPAEGERLVLTYRDPMTTDQARVVQALGARNRWITTVELRFDGEDPVTFELDESSRPEEVNEGDSPGQVLNFGRRTFQELEIVITGTDPGQLPRYDGLTPVGFAEIEVVDESGRRPVVDDVTRLPTDLLGTMGAASMEHALAVVLTRHRVAGAVAVRSSPELTLYRTFELPTERSFTLLGEVRLSPAAVSDPVLDRALGLPAATDGGLTATSQRRLPGGLTNRAMSAFDGDPDTWYSPGFLDQHGEYIRVETPEPVTFDSFGLTVLNDGRHSVPRRIRVSVDDREDWTFDISLPDIGDQPEPDARHTFDVALPGPVRGRQIQISIPDLRDDPRDPHDPAASVRAVETIDWYSNTPIAMPIGIVDVDIDGVRAPRAPELVDDRCRDDLLVVNGEPFGVELHGSTEDLLAGGAIQLRSCENGSLVLPEGTVTVDTADGAFTGFDIDRLVLRSAAGGEADSDTGPLVPVSQARDRPRVEVISEDATSLSMVVPEADQDFWLILGQSHNAGWKATADGVDLGPSVLVNGYANAWRVPGGTDIRIEVEWTPQRVVRWALGISVLGVAACLAIALWPRRRSRGSDPVGLPADRRPSMPIPFDPRLVLAYRGPLPTRRAAVVVTVGALLVAGSFIGPGPGVVMALAAVVTTRWRRCRPLLTVGGPLVFTLSVAWMALEQLMRELPPGFDWPSYFEELHRPAMLAVALVVLDVFVDRCWMRRWWPNHDPDRV